MKPNEFIAKIVDLYSLAGEITGDNGHDHIKRGRRHTISSIAEDLLARFIYNRLNDSSIRLWIDKRMSYDGHDNLRHRVFYPDVAVFDERNGSPELVASLDLKLDLGWNRDISTSFSHLAAEVVAKRKAGYVNIGTNTHDKWQKVSLTYGNHIVILSDQNTGASNWPALKAEAEKHSDYLQLYVLSGTKHLRGNSMEGVEVKEGEFTRLFDNMKTAIEQNRLVTLTP